MAVLAIRWRNDGVDTHHTILYGDALDDEPEKLLALFEAHSVQAIGNPLTEPVQRSKACSASTCCCSRRSISSLYWPRRGGPRLQ